MKLYLHDYKGKHFILADEPEDSEDTIDTDTLNLDDHADACLWYGIPMYIGSNEEFKKLCDEAMERAIKRDSLIDL